MNIDEFVKDTIVDIVNGIVEANDAIKSKSAFIASTNIVGNQNAEWRGAHDINGIPHVISNIDFDIAVSLEKKNDAEGGLKLQVASSVPLGVRLSSSLKSRVGWGKNESKLHRVQFSIPLALPTEPRGD